MDDPGVVLFRPSFASFYLLPSEVHAVVIVSISKAPRLVSPLELPFFGMASHRRRYVIDLPKVVVAAPTLLLWAVC